MDPQISNLYGIVALRVSEVFELDISPDVRQIIIARKQVVDDLHQKLGTAHKALLVSKNELQQLCNDAYQTAMHHTARDDPYDLDHKMLILIEKERHKMALDATHIAHDSYHCIRQDLQCALFNLKNLVNDVNLKLDSIEYDVIPTDEINEARVRQPVQNGWSFLSLFYSS